MTVIAFPGQGGGLPPRAPLWWAREPGSLPTHACRGAWVCRTEGGRPAYPRCCWGGGQRGRDTEPAGAQRTRPVLGHRPPHHGSGRGLFPKGIRALAGVSRAAPLNWRPLAPSPPQTLLFIIIYYYLFYASWHPVHRCGSIAICSPSVLAREPCRTPRLLSRCWGN